MLKSVAEASNALVAEVIRKARSRGQGRHHQADCQQPVRGGGPAGIEIAAVDDVRDERPNEANDWERDEHWVDRMRGDLGGTVRMTATWFAVDGSHMSSPSVACGANARR